MDQAEQMFHAATAVGPATRPLLVFYGLSQAGRAIAAAAAKLDRDDWKLKSHGISSDALDGPLPDVQITTHKVGTAGSFVRLSELLDSPLWGKAPVLLNHLWDTLPENLISPLRDEGQARRTPLQVHDRSMNWEDHPLASCPVSDFPPWHTPATQQQFLEYLTSYPEAADFDSFARVSMEPDAAPDFTPHVDGWGEVDMNWRFPGQGVGTYEQRRAYMRTIARPYDDGLFFFPAVDPNQRSLHPLMAWWALLHALSMLARYQPTDWSTHINVDHSPHAVPLERLLQRAIDVVPRLISQTIDQVARPAT